MMDEKKEARINESGLKQDFEIIITPGDVKQDVTSKVDLKEAFYNLGPSTDFASVFDLERKDFLDVLKIFSPGTAIRTALDDILRAQMGALIVLEKENIEGILEGGFKKNSLRKYSFNTECKGFYTGNRNKTQGSRKNCQTIRNNNDCCFRKKK